MIKSDLSEALSVIQSNYIDGKKLDYNSIFKSSISGMLSVLDPHSTYFDPVEYASFRTEQRSEYFGIGATIEDLREGSDVNTFIRATFSDSPAQRAGLRYGDRITAVDGILDIEIAAVSQQTARENSIRCRVIDDENCRHDITSG